MGAPVLHVAVQTNECVDQSTVKFLLSHALLQMKEEEEEKRMKEEEQEEKRKKEEKQ